MRGLARKSLRDRRRSFVAEGMRVVDEALGGRWRVTDIVGTVSAAADIERWRAEGRLEGIAVAFTDERTFRGLSDSVHPQGVLAVVEEPSQGLEGLRADGPVLLLDRLQDPGNAGTLLRTLQATGGAVVLALSGTVDLFNPKVVRASAGSLFHLDVAAHLAPDEALAWLARNEVPLFALDGAGEPIFGTSSPTPQRFALAVGNEGGGLAEPLIRHAIRRLAIPMAPGVDSLNAAIAGSVALYELARRSGFGRGEPGPEAKGATSMPANGVS